MQVNPHSPQYKIGTHRPSDVYPYHRPVSTYITNTKRSHPLTLHTQNNTSYDTHMEGRYASTTPTAHTYQTQHSTKYYGNKSGQQAYQCSSHIPDYQPMSKLLGNDENVVLGANLGMRVVATPANGHCLLHAFITMKEIKY